MRGSEKEREINTETGTETEKERERLTENDRHIEKRLASGNMSFA